MKHITSAGATALVVMSLLATAADAKDNTRHTVQQITAYCNTAKYNECHAAAANNYLACAENDVDCRCTQLQVLADQCAPLCPTSEVSNAELIRSYCAQSTMQSFAAASADVHSNSLMELKKKLKEKLFGKFKGEDPDCPDDKHEDHGDDCPEDKHNTGHDDTSGDDHCDDKCDGDDHHDDCDNKYDDDDDDCPDDKYDGEDDDDCDDKYDGEDDDDCDEECDEYDDHHDDCAQYYSYANESDTPSPSPKADAQLSAPIAQVKASNLRAMKSSYEKEAAIPGRFQRRSSIDKLRAAADAKQLHIVPRNVADFLGDEPNARLFRDFLPSAMDDGSCDDDDEDCMLDGLSPSFYADEMNALHEERASANIIGWPSIPWPWKDEDQNDDDCEDDKTPEPAPVEDDCGDEDKDQWTAPVEDDCGDEDKDQWTAPVEDDCGDEDKDQWTAPVEDDCGDEDENKWTAPVEDDCGDEDKSSWDDHSGGDEDDCGDDDKSSWDDHSGNDDDDCGEDSDKSGNEPSYDKKKSKHGVVSAPDTDESHDEDGGDEEESHGDDGDDGDDSNGDGDADSDDSESDSDDSDSDDSEVKVDGDEPKNGTRQGLRNTIKNVGANIKNATGSGVESSASSVVRQGVAEVVFGIVAAAGVGMALL